MLQKYVPFPPGNQAGIFIRAVLQLLMEQFDTLSIQCRHIEHMHEGVWFTKNNFDKMTAMRT